MSYPGIASTFGALQYTNTTTGLQEAISFQFNPATLKRTLQSNTVGGDIGERSQAVRFVGAPIETITFEAAFASQASNTKPSSSGVSPKLAALALLVTPRLGDLNQEQSLLAQGFLEVLPPAVPCIRFVWGERIIPVRITELTIQEELFDANLVPVQATVALTLRVLTYSDLLPTNPDYQLYLSYQQQLQNQAAS